VNFTPLYKSFAITERAHVELRFESFNTFNHFEFNDVQTQYEQGNFGAVTSAYDPACWNLAASSVSKPALKPVRGRQPCRALFRLTNCRGEDRS